MNESLSFTGDWFVDRKPWAQFSDCGRYRWLLAWPSGVANERVMAVVAANPSKAGQLKPDGTMLSDPTVSRMRGLAKDLGLGWLWMVNARSWIATDPREVPPDPRAIGDQTDMAILTAALGAELVLVAYGHLAGTRAPRVLELIRQAGKVPHALALTQDGTPRHPRGVPKSARPFPLQHEKGCV